MMTHFTNNINDLLRQIGNQPGSCDPFDAAIISGILKGYKDKKPKEDWDTKENNK